jgi:hypothetical protein
MKTDVPKGTDTINFIPFSALKASRQENELCIFADLRRDNTQTRRIRFYR